MRKEADSDGHQVEHHVALLKAFCFSFCFGVVLLSSFACSALAAKDQNLVRLTDRPHSLLSGCIVYL